MTDTLQPITGAHPAATTITLLYTAPAAAGSRATTIDILALNTSTSVAETYELWASPTGDGAPATQDDQLANKLVHHQPLAALERQQFTERILLAPSDKLYVRSTNGTVTFRGSVLEQTP